MWIPTEDTSGNKLVLKGHSFMRLRWSVIYSSSFCVVQGLSIISYVWVGGPYSTRIIVLSIRVPDRPTDRMPNRLTPYVAYSVRFMHHSCASIMLCTYLRKDHSLGIKHTGQMPANGMGTDPTPTRSTHTHTPRNIRRGGNWKSQSSASMH